MISTLPAISSLSNCQTPDFDRNDVEMVSLEYVDPASEYLIPFYIFYVDHEYEEMKEGVKNYGILLVPAIDAEGLSNYVMENWVYWG